MTQSDLNPQICHTPPAEAVIAAKMSKNHINQLTNKRAIDKVQI
jgi:hypothetical protein